MGLYDTIKCSYPLPVKFDDQNKCWFQTKSLGEGMLGFEITSDGRLVCHSEPSKNCNTPANWINKMKEHCKTFRGEIYFYGGYTRAGSITFRFSALFDKGKLIDIVEVPEGAMWL